MPLPVPCQRDEQGKVREIRQILPNSGLGIAFISRWMKTSNAILHLILALVLGTMGSLTLAEASPASKTEALTALRGWRARLINEDEKSNSAQKKIVTALARISLKSEAERELETSLEEISRVDGERVELEARRRLVDQIIFAVDTKWSGSDLRGFLEVQLLDFATNDLSEPGQGGWWKFLIQAAASLRESEPGSDPIKFLEAYMNASGVLEPKSAFEVLKTRNYVGE